MSKGYIVIAQNSADTNYVRMAYALALSLKITQSKVSNLSICVEDKSTVPEKYKKVFDQVIEIPWTDDAKESDWKIDNKWKYYYMTPYDETVILDADMIFPTDVSHWWDSLEEKDVWATTNIKTFRGEPADPSSKYYREYFIKNNNKPAADHALEQINKLKSLPGVLLYIDQILNEGRLGMAEAKCRAFLKENPTHTYAMSLLSDIANRLGYFDDAEFLLEKAVEFKPDDGDLRLKYASILRKKQKFAKTMEQVNILCDKYPENLNYQAQKASEIMQNGDHEKAINLLDDILSKNPYNFSTLTSKGHAQKTLGRTDEAIKSYQSAYQIKPDHGEAFFSLANLKTYSFSENELKKWTLET